MTTVSLSPPAMLVLHRGAPDAHALLLEWCNEGHPDRDYNAAYMLCADTFEYEFRIVLLTRENGHQRQWPVRFKIPDRPIDYVRGDADWTEFNRVALAALLKDLPA